MVNESGVSFGSHRPAMLPSMLGWMGFFWWLMVCNGHFFHKNHEHLPRRLTRSASSGISQNEVQYVEDRKKHTSTALHEFFKNSNVDFDPSLFTDSVVGLAFSGGGYRAMLTGAGEVAALDARTKGNNGHGHIGGLLQGSSYITGLSGGGWLLGSVYFRNFSTVENIVNEKDLWDLEKPLFVAEQAKDCLSKIKLYWRLYKNVSWKKSHGYSVTITDLWGRFLYRQLIAGFGADDILDNNPRFWRWSDLRHEHWYTERLAPFPIITVLSRVPVYRPPHEGSAIIEISPLEIGSYDKDVDSFVDIEYLGVKLINGRPDEKNPIIVGLDEAGFLLGASSSLFDQIFTGIIENLTTSKSLANSLRWVLQHTGIMGLRDVAAISPNPFLGLSHVGNGKGSAISSSSTLYVADGGSNGLNIPLQPLLEPSREVDAIIAFDNSGAELDVSWPDGSPMTKSYERQFLLPGSPPMPYVPDKETFVNLGLASRPTFFGCYAQNLTNLPGDNVPPLIIYIPNAGYSTFSNTSTFQLAYTDKKVKKMIQNGYNVATRGNGTFDEEWAACLACAVSQRSRERQNLPLSEQCKRCFDRYCWNGEIASDGEEAFQTLRTDRSLLLQN
ncbi:Lysophospholipase 1 [Wickerhamiella sorbophila]|uniref:Lysophospholipase n=1 Tax=Wickerhamiella sorbophila TaxID=45607 RepID=A0A2T0FM32_9ASCO|nr:Lysophospholipase 1 [Wickerhamiella sorbophila]PRT56040.1 Lysophospholipase 1 [Wickerhamiella sorbophila]